MTLRPILCSCAGLSARWPLGIGTAFKSNHRPAHLRLVTAATAGVVSVRSCQVLTGGIGDGLQYGNKQENCEMNYCIELNMELLDELLYGIKHGTVK